MLESGISMRSRGRGRRAFTLIELLTVIAIIAVLAGIVIGIGRRVSETGRIARAKAEMAALSAALENYRRHFGDFPQVGIDSGTEGTVSGQALFAALNGWRGPGPEAATFATRGRVFAGGAGLTLAVPEAADIAANHFVDPWGHSYHYAYAVRASGWTGSSFILYSAGPDGLADSPAATGIVDVSTPANADNLYANP